MHALLLSLGKFTLYGPTVYCARADNALRDTVVTALGRHGCLRLDSRLDN